MARVVRVNLRLAVALFALAMASPAHASPISAHAMVHSCCTSSAMKERIFSEAKELGAAYIRVDVEMSSIFEDPDGSKSATPNWAGLNQVMALSKKYELPVLAILLSPPRFTSSCPERWPDSGRCAAADTAQFGALAGEIAKHAEGSIDYWEIVNEPDGDWAFEGTPEQYAAMLSAAHDGIKAQVPGAQVVLGGLMRPHEPGWLERVFATPGTDAIHKFDIANVHLRGPVDNVVRRYQYGRAQALDLQRAVELDAHAVPDAAGCQDDERQEDRGNDSDRETGTQNGLTPPGSLPRERHRERQQHGRVELGGDAEPEQHMPEAQPSRDERREGTDDECDGPQVITTQHERTEQERRQRNEQQHRPRRNRRTPQRA